MARRILRRAAAVRSQYGGRNCGQRENLRGGSANRSQILMRWRVGLQALAIAAIVVAIYLRKH